MVHRFEAELDCCGRLPDTRLTVRVMVRELLDRYLHEIRHGAPRLSAIALRDSREVP